MPHVPTSSNHPQQQADAGTALAGVMSLANGASILPAALQMLPEMAWYASADGRLFVGNDRVLARTGKADAVFASADWLHALHEDDRSTVATSWAAGIATGAPFEAVARHRCTLGGFGWVQVRAVPVRDADGILLHWVAIATDVDDLKTKEARAVLIANELAHRNGNIFAVIAGMLALSTRAQPEAANFARTMAARIAALATAHAFIWPPTQCGDAPPQPVARLIELLVKPYGAPDGPQIVVAGNDAVVDGAAATCITLIIHELATNAAKHGALSSVDGRLDVRLRRTPTMLTIIWAERGGPGIVQPPSRSGFGTGLIDRVTRLGPVSRARRWWRPNGLVMALCLPIDPPGR